MPANIRYRRHSTVVSGALTPLDPPAPWHMDDFMGDSIDARWLLTQSGSATAAGAISVSAGDPVAGHGGWVAGATDDVDAESDEFAFAANGAAQYRADQVGLGGVLAVEWALTIPTALTTRQYFAGFSDDPLEGSGAMAFTIASGTTVTDTATDGGGWGFYSAATDATHWVGISTDSGTQSTITQGPLAVFDTWIGLRTEIQPNGDLHYLTRSKRGGNLTYQGKSNEGTSPDALLVPYFGAAPTTTTAVPWEIDYMFVTCGTLA